MSDDNNVQKSLEKLDKELDMFIAIKQKIERSFTQNETTLNEEKNLQMKIAQLNAGLQFFSTMTFGCITIGAMLAICGIQRFFDLPPAELIQFITTFSQLLALVIAEIAFVAIGLFAFYKSFAYWKEIEKRTYEYMDKLSKKEQQKL